MRNLRKSFSLLLVLAMVVSLFSGLTLNASAADTVTTVEGSTVINKGGVYQLTQEATGLITIKTTEPVTIVGNGTTWDESYAMTATPQTSLGIDCTVAGVELTIQDLYCNTNSSEAPNYIDFMGEGNKLHLAGVNLLDNFSNFSYASIHVPTDGDLTIDGDGTLYLYKSASGAGIGGDANETNGDVIINGGTIFAKGSQTGSTIGAGQSAIGGTITINGGNVYAMSNARGSVLGGGGYSSGEVGVGGAVSINGGSVMLVSDWSGAAVGGGGGNNSAAEQDGGTLVINGGSLKCRVNKNAYSTWGVEDNGAEYAITDASVTAEKLNGSGNAIYRLVLPLDGVTANESGDQYVVSVDGTPFYSGNGYHNTFDKQTSGTVVNWPVGDPENSLYLYLTGQTHTVRINGTTNYYYFDPATVSFSAGEAPTGQSYTLTAEQTTGVRVSLSAQSAIRGETITATPTVENGYELVCVQWKLAGSDDWTTISALNGKYQFTMPEADVIVRAEVKAIPMYDENGAYLLKDRDDLLWFADKVSSGQNAIQAKLMADIDISDMEWTPIGSNTDVNSRFTGVFDGNGKTITLRIGSEESPASGGYQGLFGYVQSATIENLTVDGAIYVGGSNVGAVAGYTSGADTVIRNCINKAAIVASGYNYIGGVVGYNSSFGEVTGCINKGDVTGSLYVGGVVGYSNAATLTISDCKNSGTITASGVAGGIVSSTATDTVIMRCSNTGEITASTYGGGIAGAHKGTISLCVNTGAVTCSGSSAGIAGSNNGNITDCYNIGVITSTASGFVAAFAGSGGIVGYGTCSLTNCYSTGAVTVTGGGAGALTGASGATVENSYYLNSVQVSEEDLGVAKTTEEMIATEFVTLLGDAYLADLNGEAAINSGYPVLWWQLARTVALPEGEGYTITPVEGFSTEALEGDSFQFTVEAAEGYRIDSVLAGQTELAADEDGVYTITVTGDVTITVNASRITYRVTLPESDNYTVAAAEGYTTTVAHGDPFQFTVEAAEGYQIDSVLAGQTELTADEDGVYTITVTNDVAITVSASSTAHVCPSAHFVDVNQAAWYHEAVDYCVANDLMNGVSATSFAPDMDVSRAMFITMIYRLEDSPEVTGETTYTDVIAGAWYEDAVIWGTENGIVNGYNGKFEPAVSITREQMAAMMQRYAAYAGNDTSAKADVSNFVDSAQISSWATENVQWAVAVQLLHGTDHNQLLPQSSASRVQAATVLMRFAENILK